MPTYTVYSPVGVLSDAQKRAIAREVTHVHSQVTGAQTFFAQVVFQDVPAGNWFIGGAPLEGKQIYLCGHVRGGRPAQMKRKLVLAIRDALVAHASVDGIQVWVYIVELPAALMVEYGHVLPEPGQETKWLADMPVEDRTMLESLGRSRED
jgi:phenylpyruvate tautomerase PptA (4-oxalocrotonate tautomerase family)